MGNILKTRGIILSSIRWKESSKIVTIYCEQLGKIKIIARGALKNNSPFSGKLESLFLVELLIDVKDSRSLQILKEIDILNSFHQIKIELGRFSLALSILEVINQICDEANADKVFFDFILEMLNALTNSKNPQHVFVYFLIKISSYLGFKPALTSCFSGDFSKCDNKVFLSVTDGNVYCNNCLIKSGNAIVLLKDQYFYLKNLQKIHFRRIKNAGTLRNDFAQLIQIMLKYINYHLDQNIHVEALQLLNKYSVY